MANTSLAFDAGYYLAQRSDVALYATQNGLDAAAFALEHFNTYGWYEGTNPNASFDVNFYRSQYSDVSAANINPFQHFWEYGAAEGRNPNEAFLAQNIGSNFDAETYLAANPDVADAVATGAMTAYEHYVLYGQFEGRPGAQLQDGTAIGSGGGSGGDSVELTNDTDVLEANQFTSGLVYTPGGNDRINALQDEDVLTGAGTNPTLTATLGNANDNGATIITPTLNNIETINVAFTGSGAAVDALDLQDATGLNTLNITRISQAVDQAEVGNIRTAVENMSIANTNANQNGVVEISFVADALEGETTGELELNNVNVGAVNIGQNTSGIAARGVGLQGYETLTVNSTGAPNTVGALNLPMDTGTNGQVIITGDQDLTLATVAQVSFPGNRNLVESTTYAGGVDMPQGRLAAIDASGFTGDLTLNIATGIFTTGKAETSGVDQDVAITGGTGDDTFILRDRIQSGDLLAGGEGTDTLIVNDGGVIDADSSIVTGIEEVESRLDGAGAAAVATIDFDKLADATHVTVRNEGSDDVVAIPSSQAQTATFNLNNLTAEQAAAITIEHSNSFSNGIAQNIINATLKDASGGADLVNLTIAEGFNQDPRFNTTLNTQVAEGALGDVENLTLTDSDSESNTVALGSVDQHTGTITLTGGVDGTFLNLDTTTVGANGGLYQYAVDGGNDAGNSAAANGRVADHSLTANQVKLIAATIDASAEVSDVIVRVSTNENSVDGAQSITMGAGDDTVIFDHVGRANEADVSNAGLSIVDTVAGGEGHDTLVIDGDVDTIPGIALSLSEWTNVSGFETIRTIGAGAGKTYSLTLSNDLIGANQDENGLLNIVNDNDAFNDTARTVAQAAAVTVDGGNDDGLGNVAAFESAITIDARGLNSQTHFSYNGEEGSSSTADRIILSDENINGANIIDGGAIDNITNNSGIASNNGTSVVGNGQEANLGNNDVIEVRNKAEVLLGDLANVKNIGTLSFTNDTASPVSSTLELTDSVVDSLVDSYQTSVARNTTPTDTTGGGNVEILRINAIDNINTQTKVITSTTGLTINASALTSRSDLNITLGRGENDVATGGGNDTVVLLGNYESGNYAAGINENGVDIAAQANNLVTAGVVVAGTQRVVTDDIDLGRGDDTLVTYGDIDLTGADFTNNDGEFQLEHVEAHSNLTMTASQVAALQSLTFVQGVDAKGTAIDHSLTIVNDGSGAVVDLSKIVLQAGAGDLNLVVKTGVETTGTAVDNDLTDSGEIVPTVDGYTLKVSDGAVDEGSNVTFTITRTVAEGEVAPAAVFKYTLAGDGIEAEDFTNTNGLLAGVVEFAEGQLEQTVTLNVAADATTEGNETLAFALDNGLSRTVLINDTSEDGDVEPTYALTVNQTAVNETDNNQVTVTLTTTGVAEGTEVNYNITGTDVNAADFTSGFDGVFVVGANGIATATLELAADESTDEGEESFVVGIGVGGVVSPVVTVADSSTASGGGTANNLDTQGSEAEAAILDAALGAFNFTDSAAVANNVEINNFTADDMITITGATATDYDSVISSDAAGDVTIAYNAAGTVSQIVLTGVAAGGLVFDVASFNALGVGDLTFA